MLGPGDVIGINPRAIVKTEPRNWVTDFEVELPAVHRVLRRRLSVALHAGHARPNALEQSRLRPWIFLVVLEEDEFVEPKRSGPLPAFEHRGRSRSRVDLPGVRIKPGPGRTCTSARTSSATRCRRTTAQQVSRRRAEPRSRRLRANADVASSRLLCARKLEEEHGVSRVRDPGVRSRTAGGPRARHSAGHERPASSWGDGQRVYPIYYRWFFRTGAKGDFEFLVDLLEPRPADKRVGVRAMDMQDPGYEVEGMSGALRVMGLEGALEEPGDGTVAAAMAAARTPSSTTRLPVRPGVS